MSGRGYFYLRLAVMFGALGIVGLIQPAHQGWRTGVCYAVWYLVGAAYVDLTIRQRRIENESPVSE